MENLTPKNGLSQGYIGAIHQDKSGYLWLGTKNGLNRYNGRQFRVFTSDPFKPFTLTKDYINHIEGKDNWLLIGTQGGGLNLYNSLTERFYGLEADGLPLERGKNATVSRVATDAKGNIWLAVVDDKNLLTVYYIPLPNDFWAAKNPPANHFKNLKAEQIGDGKYSNFTMSLDKKTLYLSENQYLIKISIEHKKVEKVQTTETINIVKIVENKEEIWVLRQRSLEKINHGQSHIFPLDFFAPDKFLLFDKAHRLWIHENDELLVFYMPANGTSFRKENAVLRSHIPYAITSAWCDPSGIVWLGSSGYGLFKFNPRLHQIRHFFAPNPIYAPLYTGKKGTLGVYNFIDNDYLFEPKLPQLYPSLRAKDVAKRPIFSQLFDANFDANTEGGYWKYDEDFEGCHWKQLTANGTELKHFRFSTPSSNTGIAKIGKDGMLWSAHDGHLYQHDPATGQVQDADFNATVGSKATVLALEQTPDGTWWIGTTDGLIQAIPNPKGYNFQIFKQKQGDKNTLLNNNVASILIDPKEATVLWIGTKGGGLARFDTKTMQFRHLTMQEGLPNDVIYGVLNDDEGHLWLSSNKGIIRYNPTSGDIKNFTEEDGLLNNELNTWAYAKAANGEMLFGGVNGLNVFHPKNLTENPHKTTTVIDAILVNNKNITPYDTTGLITEGVSFLQKIRLPFGQNNLTIQFAALEYSAPFKNRFRYYLDGAEPEWAHESTENFATYLNLSSGSYTFKVKSANGDGVWNDTIATLNIVILPPWYRSWWAYLVYAVLAFAGVRWYWRFQENRLRLQHDLALKDKEAHRLAELDSFKNQFFTNITHEFRTPLTVILGMTEKLKNQIAQLNTDVKSDFLKTTQLIERNSQSLLRLINQILDISKLEHNSLIINNQQGDIMAYCRYVVESFHSIANVQNTLLKIETTPLVLMMDFDAERLQQVLYNLISNAIKFTPSGGRITVKMAALDAKQLSIKVSDTGVGIPQKDLPFVFDRFFQAKNQSKVGGTGIGLALTKELIKAMNGEISVESKEQQGTTFTLLLPIKNEAILGDNTLITNDLVPTQTFQKFPTFGKLEGEKPHLLIIEDNADVVEYIASCLSDTYQLDFAYNGRIGYEKALETTPQMIISDVMMPEMDGFMVCDALKNDMRSSHIPIVLLTARATVEDRIAGLKRGADAYLAKPFHPEELMVTLQKLLDNQRRLQAYFTQKLLENAPNTEGVSTTSVETEIAIEDAFLIKLRTLLEEKISETDLNAEDIGKKLGMSRSNLYNKLAALTGLSFNIYLRELRLQKAKTLLATTDMNVSEVAYEVGFSDPRYFSRVFSEKYGVPPSTIKEQS